MTEKPLENEPHLETPTAPTQGAEFLEFQHWKAQKEQEQRDEARRHFSQQADDQHAQEVKAKILKFPEQGKAPDVAPAEPLEMSAQDRELLEKRPLEWLQNAIGKKRVDDPYSATEALGEAQEIDQRNKAA